MSIVGHHELSSSLGGSCEIAVRLNWPTVTTVTARHTNHENNRLRQFWDGDTKQIIREVLDVPDVLRKQLKSIDSRRTGGHQHDASQFVSSISLNNTCVFKEVKLHTRVRTTAAEEA